MKCETNKLKLKLQNRFQPELDSTTGDIAVDAFSRARAQVAHRRLLVIPRIDDNLRGQVEKQKKGVLTLKRKHQQQQQRKTAKQQTEAPFRWGFEIKQNEDSNFYEFVIVLKRHNQKALELSICCARKYPVN